MFLKLEIILWMLQIDFYLQYLLRASCCCIENMISTVSLLIKRVHFILESQNHETAIFFIQGVTDLPACVHLLTPLIRRIPKTKGLSDLGVDDKNSVHKYTIKKCKYVECQIH